VETSLSILDRSFDDIIFEAINESLIKIFGEETARSVNFYIDPNIALTDAEAYVKALRRMFMEGADVIVVGICDRISQLTGLVTSGGSNLGEFIRDVRGRYVHQTRADRSGTDDGSFISAH
jgi:hypothetical protein